MARHPSPGDSETSAAALSQDQLAADRVMTSITLTNQQLDRLADALADKVADRLADRLAPQVAEGARAPSGHARLVDAAALASLLGVSRETVYEHADELGAVRIGEVGDGKRPRLRFDVDQALERWTARVSSERSHPPDPPAAAGQSRRRRRRAAGSGVELLPIRGRNTP